MFYRSHKPVSLDCGDQLITKQSHKKECDIYNILNQFQKTGIFTHINNQQPLYTDLPSDIDYQQSLNLTISANSTFATLPASVRDHFHNDPQRFLAAFHDPAQTEYLRESGFLTPKPPAPDPSPAPAV